MVFALPFGGLTLSGSNMILKRIVTMSKYIIILISIYLMAINLVIPRFPKDILREALEYDTGNIGKELISDKLDDIEKFEVNFASLHYTKENGYDYMQLKKDIEALIYGSRFDAYAEKLSELNEYIVLYNQAVDNFMLSLPDAESGIDINLFEILKMFVESCDEKVKSWFRPIHKSDGVKFGFKLYDMSRFFI